MSNLDDVWKFGEAEFRVKRDEILTAMQNEVANLKRVDASRGTILSGGHLKKVAKLYADSVITSAFLRLNALLEGCEIYGVEITDAVEKRLMDDVLHHHKMMQAASRSGLKRDPQVGGSMKAFVAGRIGLDSLIQYFDDNSFIDRNALFVTIKRKRHMKKPSGNTVVSTSGNNNLVRVHMNGTDQSVNTVTIHNREQVFTQIRDICQQQIANEEERKQIIAKLDALEASQGTPKFAHNYTDFIGTAQRYVSVLAPFIPMLTEMLKHSLS